MLSFAAECRNGRKRKLKEMRIRKWHKKERNETIISYLNRCSRSNKIHISVLDHNLTLMLQKHYIHIKYFQRQSGTLSGVCLLTVSILVLERTFFYQYDFQKVNLSGQTSSLKNSLPGPFTCPWQSGKHYCQALTKCFLRGIKEVNQYFMQFINGKKSIRPFFCKAF